MLMSAPCRRPLVSAALLSVLIGCGGGGPDAETAGPAVVAQRWIEEEPTAFFSPEQLSAEGVQFSWSFDTAQAAATWQVTQGGPGALEDGGLRFVDAPEIRLVRACDFSAAAIERIHVRVRGNVYGELALFWAGPNQRLHRDRRLAISMERPRSDHPDTYVFDLGAEPAWQGTIRTLRLDLRFAGARNVEVDLLAVEGVSLRQADDRLAPALAQAWKVTLDDEIRNAWLAPPGLPRARSIEVAGGSALHLGYGLDAEAAAPVTFRVLAHPSGGSAREVFAATLSPGRDVGWRDAAVDLSDFADQHLELTLETASQSGGFDLSHGLPYWAEPMLVSPADKEPPPNLIFVVVDTLRADHLSLYGYERPTSPRLDAWAAERAVVFEQAVAAAPWTLPSHISMFTGLDPMDHGKNYDEALPASVVTLAERLRAAGYSTMAITGGAYVHPRYGLHQGFDRFRYWSPPDSRGELEDGTRRALAWLDELAEHPRPFFLFFHTYEVHDPFHAREPYHEGLAGAPGEASFVDRLKTRKIPQSADQGFVVKRRFMLRGEDGEEPLGEEDLVKVRGLYDSGIAYTDAKLGEIFDRLAAHGLDRRTAVVLTSDHGEALGERGLAAHAYLYDFNLLVPMVLALPGGEAAGRRVESQVRGIDVYATLLDLAGSNSAEAIAGIPTDSISLLPLARSGDTRDAPPREAWSYAASSNFGASLRVGNRIKYIFNNSPFEPIHGEEELYRLVDDPAEQNNLAPSGEESLDGLRRRLHAKMDDGFRGLRITARNVGSTPFSAALSSAYVIKPTRIKAGADLPTTVVWERGELVFEVLPGKEFELLAETEARREILEIRIERPGRESCKATVDLADLAEEPRTIDLDGAACELVASGGPFSASGLEFALEASAPLVEDESEMPVDPELREQLRALGYID